ncbi:MAG: AraC family ligand binding domain-containing protein [Rhodospirillales bacterium]|nr:AraC family ligand binding domain-containing protein [Rhodospirillales bacterium]
MAITHIKTTDCPRKRLGIGEGLVANVLEEGACGARNIIAKLRWLKDDDRFDLVPLPGTHQLVYFKNGEGAITLEGKTYNVSKGAGIYLAPTETAYFEARGDGILEFFHLIVPEALD